MTYAAIPGYSEKRATRVPLWARARVYTEEMLGLMVGLARNAESEMVRKSAIDSVLDRAWGKAPIIVAGDEERPITVDVRGYDNETIKSIEATLMRVLAPAIASSIDSTLTADQDTTPSLVASESQTAPVSGVAMVSVDGDPAASDADKERTE